MSTMIDISWPLAPGMVSYKNRHPLAIEQLRSIACHSVADSLCSRLHMHAGTHVDAPSHFIEGGKTIDQLSLAQMNGPCRVLDLTTIAGEFVEKHHLAPFQIGAGERILLKTQNSFLSAQGPYNVREVYLGSSAAQYLAGCNIALLGIDALGLERNQSDYASHIALFSAGVIVVEGLRLAAVPSDLQECVLHLLPLAFVGTEAAPARALLMVA
ncbi:MAG: arylformamidase [Candidatus Dependentiae bacterium]|nr:arylformamidase [Candidatus Dependentiae bacterium]